jgi:hypothetical protein
MSAPRFFWLSATISLLAIAVSVCYFFLVVLPATQQHRDELSAEVSNKQARNKQVIECAEQARRATEEMGKYSSGFGPPPFGPPPTVSGSSNHYNRKLGNCIVDVQTADRNSTTEFVLDAYQQSNIVTCVTLFVPKGTPPMNRTCVDSQGKRIDPSEADKQIDALMRE